MTDDLVKRLREEWTPIYGGCVGTMFEAADRIEKLEAQVSQLRAAMYDMTAYISRAVYHHREKETLDAIREMRAALEGKDAST